MITRTTALGNPFVWLIIASATLVACGEQSGPTSSTSGAGIQAQQGESPSNPCFTDDCAEPITIATIPDAENMAFGPNGRLYVTGGTDIFEVKPKGDSYEATPISEGGCNFTGITFIGNQLYAACGEGSFWTADLNDEPLRVKRFYQIDGLGLANGLVAAPDGAALLVADGPLPTNNLTTGKIVKINLSEPGKASNDQLWLDMPGRFPNGLQRQGSTIFVSESVPPSFGQISRIGYGSDGQPRSDLQLVAALPSIPDDFSILNDGLAVTLFFDGSISKYNFFGILQETTSRGRFETGVSQVRVGKGDGFRASDVLVTVKGLIGETNSPVGNKLVLYRRIN